MWVTPPPTASTSGWRRYPGWWSPSRIARGTHLDTAQARALLVWLDRHILVAAAGNGCWRTYSSRRPRR
jgi:hypothetical protein